MPCLLYLIYVAGSWALADIYARPVMNVMRRWNVGQRPLKEDDWTRYRENLTTALSLDPTNPDIHHIFGKVTEGPYAKYGLLKTVAKASRLEAANYYRESIRLRPTWPYAWIALALVKYRLFEIDDEFFQAVHQSMHYGPWEPDILRVVAEFGMVLWKILEYNEREFFLATIRRSFLHASESHVEKIKKFIVKRGFIDKVCETVDDNIPLIQWCVRQ